MQELQELIKFLKDKGFTNTKIDVDLLCGIIEYFGEKQEQKQSSLNIVSHQRELLDAFVCTMEFDTKHGTYQEDIDYFLEAHKSV